MDDKQIIAWYEKKYGPYIEKRGLNNWKNLFRKPTLLEWTIFFMLLMGIYLGWAYMHDRAVLINNACDICKTQQQFKIDTPNINLLINYTILKEENLTGKIGGG